MPLPLPQPALEDEGGGQQVADLPIPLLNTPTENVPETPGTLPIPIPKPTNEMGAVNDQVGSDQIGDMPFPLPKPAEHGAESPGDMPIPMPNPAYGGPPGSPPPPPDHGSEVGGVLPVPIPRPVLEDEGGGGENVAGLPIPIFQPAIEDDGSGGRMEEPDHGPNPLTNQTLTPDDVKQGSTAGNNPAYPGDPGDPAPPPDMGGNQVELSPDDVKQSTGQVSGLGENLVGEITEPGGEPPGPNAEGNPANMSTYGANPGVPEGDGGWVGTVGSDPIVEQSQPVEQVETPEGVEFQAVGEDLGTIGRAEHPRDETPELSLTPENKNEANYVDARGVIRNENSDDPGTGAESGEDDNEVTPINLP